MIKFKCKFIGWDKRKIEIPELGVVEIFFYLIVSTFLRKFNKVVEEI